jgi:hypothetical protein
MRWFVIKKNKKQKQKGEKEFQKKKKKIGVDQCSRAEDIF